MTIQALFEQVDHLATAEKWQLVNYLLQSLAVTSPESDTAWQDALKATAGILADDPIERPPQLPLDYPRTTNT